MGARERHPRTQLVPVRSLPRGAHLWLKAGLLNSEPYGHSQSPPKEEFYSF